MTKEFKNYASNNNCAETVASEVIFCFASQSQTERLTLGLHLLTIAPLKGECKNLSATDRKTV